MNASRLPWLFLPILASGLVAQQTLFVGPGLPFADMQSAINASAPGDTIVVRPLLNGLMYPGCTVPHALTIRSEQVGIRARLSVLSTNLAAGASVHVQDMEIGSAALTGGLVTLEEVSIWSSTAPALLVNQSSVVLRRYEQFGKAVFHASSVAVVDSLVRSPVVTLILGPAMTLNQSVGFFSQSTFQNRDPNGGFSAVEVNAGSRADFVDCTVQGVPSPGMPWVATPSLVVNAGGTARQHRTTFSDGVSGSGVTGLVQPHTMLGASLTQTQLLVGGSMDVQFHAEPLDVVFVLATFQLDPPTLAPLVEPEQWGFAANGFVVTAQFADAAGLTTFSTTFANNPSLRGAGIWLMGASGLTFPLPLSVPVGGLLQ